MKQEQPTPPSPLHTVERNGRTMVFDPLRRRYVTLTPEEHVRQLFCHYLTSQRHYPASAIGNEVSLDLYGARKRCDTVVYDHEARPLMIIEYKAPEVEITQRTFDQIMRYNIRLRVRWLVVTNGRQHFCCQVDYARPACRFLPQVPLYEELLAAQ